MKLWVYSIALGLAVLGAAPTAQAKSLSRMVAELGLSPADFDQMNAAANSLFASGRPSAGQEVAWANDETGSKGTVLVREMRGDCAHLQYLFVPGGEEATREIRTRRCQDASGNWILTP